MTVQETAKGGAGRGRLRRFIGALAFLALAVAMIVVGFRTTAHVRHDPAFCAEGCHVPKQGETFAAHGHKEETCQECHTTPLKTALDLYYRKVLGKSDLPKHSRAKPDACIECHDKNPVLWRQIEATEGHRGHRGVKKVDCFSCHGDWVHKGQKLDEKLCFDCHLDQRLHKTAVEGETCLGCHSFWVALKPDQKPRSIACASCHADPKKVLQAAKDANPATVRVVDKNSVHGALDCKLCHQPHPRRALPDGQPICARCHQYQMFVDEGRGKKGVEGHVNCAGCHEPHAQRKHALDSCAKCHEKRVKGVTEKGAVEKTSALRHESCASCHLPHSWRAEKDGCATCHKEQAANIKDKSPATHDLCSKCHEVHGPPPTTESCLKCHGPTKRTHVFAAPAKHKDCKSCHEPHTATMQAARNACATCHLTQAAQVSVQGPKKHAEKGCAGCHKPHDNPAAPVDLCNKCHADKVRAVASAEPAKHKDCKSCHEPHKFAIKDVGAACNKCHAQTIDASSGAAHKGDCKSCHSLHGSAVVQRTACFKCHDKVQAAFKPPSGAGAEPHNKCKSCHQPHRPASAASGKCASCHDRQVAVAKMWPAKSDHAKECKTCHQPHEAGKKKACADCHQKEAQSAMGGKHQCAGCHAPHRTPPGVGKAWWGRCNDCHQKQVESSKKLGPKHSDCQNCHKPHKFEPPTCNSCHQGQEAKGLHGQKEHAAKCAACHDPHQKSEPSRAQCLSCHQKMQNHEPLAQKCQACHPFK